MQLANKTKEMGTVMRQTEHYRNVCRDLEVKLMRQGELLDENIARKAALQDEINEVEARIAAEENGPPPAPQPVLLLRCRWSFHLLLKKKWMRIRRWKVKPLILGLVLVPLRCLLRRGASNLRFGSEPLSDCRSLVRLCLPSFPNSVRRNC